MGKRRRRLKPGGPRKQYTSTKQTHMLNIQQKAEFKYHLNGILRESEMKEEQKPSFIANVLSKAAQNSIADAKDYVKGIEQEGLIEGETSERILRLLNKFTTRR